MKKLGLTLGLAVSLAMASTAPVYAAQKQSTPQWKNIELNAMKVASAPSLTAVDPSTKRPTTYLSLYYVMQTLQKLGIQSQWNGRVWSIQTPPSLPPQTGTGKLSAQPVSVTMNGTQVQSDAEVVSIDPSSHLQTAYLPLYDIIQLLHRVNVQSTWDGTTWNMSAPKHPMYGGNLRIDSFTVRDLDPARSFDSTSQNLIQQVYDTLVTYDAQGKLVPSLASSYSVSADGLTYTFHLHQNVKFSNGDSATAQSFVDEFERVLSKQVASPGESYLDPIVVGATDFANQTSSTVRGLTTPDPYTLVIQLTKPEPFFLDVLALPYFSPVDQAFINKVGNKAFDSTAMLGTGPFMLSSVTQTQYVLKRNPYYWKTDSSGDSLPYLDQVTINTQPNPMLNAHDFQTGETALLGAATNGVLASALSLFNSTPTLQSTLQSQPENGTYYLGLNNQMAPFNDPKFRQALEYAINKQAIVTQILHGAAEVANQPLPPNMPGYMTNLPSDVNYTYNPTLAQSMLVAAGYQPGQTTVTLYSANDPTSVQIDQEVQSNLEQVGVHCTIQSLSWGPFLNQALQGKLPFYQLAWLQDYPDPSDFLNTLFNSNQAPMNNLGNYSNPQVDAWLNQAQTDVNSQERMDLYNKVTEQVMRDAAWIPMYYPTVNYAVQPWLHGYSINPVTNLDTFGTLWLDPNHD